MSWRSKSDCFEGQELNYDQQVMILKLVFGQERVAQG